VSEQFLNGTSAQYRLCSATVNEDCYDHVVRCETVPNTRSVRDRLHAKYFYARYRRLEITLLAPLTQCRFAVQPDLENY